MESDIVKVLALFSKQSPDIDKIIGANNEDEYNYLIRKIYKNYANKDSIQIVYKPISLSTNTDLTSIILQSAQTMNLNALENEDITLTNNPLLNQKIKKGINEIIAPAIRTITNANIKMNFFIKEIVWLYDYINKFDWSGNKVPIVVYYGDISKDESILFRTLNKVGCEFIYINSLEDTELLDGNLIKFSDILQLQPFLTRVSSGADEYINTTEPQNDNNKTGNYIDNNCNSNIIETISKKAKENINNDLFKGTGIFNPWSFENGTTVPLYLNGVIQDIMFYWNEEARFRLNFKVENETVFIPKFFTKINGIYADLKKYKELVEKTIKSDLTLLRLDTKINKKRFKNQEIYSLAFMFKNTSYEIDFDKLVNNKLYALKDVNIWCQKFMVKKLSEFLNINKDKIDKKKGCKLLAYIINLDAEISHLIENFDFPLRVPKIIFYIYDRKIFNDIDSLILQYLSNLGLDILIYSPCGAPVIEESMLNSNYLNSITLDEMKENLTYSTLQEIKVEEKKSLLKKLFNI